MMGKCNKNQISFADLGYNNVVDKKSYWHRLRVWAEENLTETDFEKLFSCYGRPSISPIYTFLGMLIQLEKNWSDRELEEETRYDDRVKHAIGATHNFKGIDAITLHDHRERFFTNDIGPQFLAKTVQNAKDTGLFSFENIHALDAFMVWGSAAKQSTYALIYQGIKLVLRFGQFHEIDLKSLIRRTDYDMNQKKPKINWEDDKEKKELLQSLVDDAHILINYIRMNQNTPKDLVCVCQKLEKVATQDVTIDKDGKVEIKIGTAADRIISIIDPEIRHGRKTTSNKSDGYKCEIITGGKQSSIVMDLEIDPANVPDGNNLEKLVDSVLTQTALAGNEREPSNCKCNFYGDTSYAKWELIEKYEERNTTFTVKAPSCGNSRGLYTKENFAIDLENGKITCPAHHTEKFDLEMIKQRVGTTVVFPDEKCNSCPLRKDCTNSLHGRHISLHPYEDRLIQQRMYQKTIEFKEDYKKRSNVERTISHLTHHGGRQGRYIGKAKTKWQLLMTSIGNNIKVIMNFKLTAVPV